MGLISYYLGYRHATKRPRESVADSLGAFDTDAECAECGHPDIRHDDHGCCPSYE